VLVCFGETHTFKISEDVTFGELLERASKRWNLVPSHYELQDDNFATLDSRQLVLKALKGGTKLIRLAKKLSYGLNDQGSNLRGLAPQGNPAVGLGAGKGWIPGM